MRLDRVLASFLFLAATSISEPAQAVGVRGTASTLLAGRQDPNESDVITVVPLYELVSMNVDAIAIPGFDQSRVVLQGWGRLQFGQDSIQGNDADLGLLFLEALRGPLTIRLGRQHVAGGGAQMAMIDGGTLDVRWRMLSLQTFAGTVVHRTFDSTLDDRQAGARLAARLGLAGEVGLSYRQLQLDTIMARETISLDGFYQLSFARLIAFAAVSPRDRRLVEARLASSFSLPQQVLLTVDGERVAPDLLLPRTSIFSAFAAEAHDEVGGDVSWRPSPYYDLTVAAHALRASEKSTSDDGVGHKASLRATTYREASHRSLIGLECSRLSERNNGYWRARLLTLLALTPKLSLAADAFAYVFDETINDVRRSYVAQASATFDILPSLRVVATAAGGVTPYTRYEVEGMLRLAYGYETDLAREWIP